MVKRIRIEENNENTVGDNLKKQKRENYYSASSVHNYMLKDPIMDWIKSKPKNEGSPGFGRRNRENVDLSSFENFIKNRGNEFENHVMSLITEKLKKLGEDIVTVSRSEKDILNIEKYDETVEHINNQVGIIYQGVLYGNEDFKAYGSPDLLVRSDLVNKIINVPLNHGIKKRSNGKYPYVVVDIKFCTLSLTSDGVHICNNARMPANKGQIIIYNNLLGIAQGYIPRYCYILGRGWKNTKCGKTYSDNDCLDKLGTIDTRVRDNEYQEKTKKALIWLERLEKYGHSWATNPPSVPELYPNMCNTYDNGNYVKKNIAKEIDEITLLWNTGVKHRERAHENGIYKFTDQRLTTEILGFPKDTARTKVIDKMLRFNQSKIYPDKLIIPEIIDNNPYNWQDITSLEFFLDFETITDVFYNRKRESRVFMIGLGVITVENGMQKWEYYNFRVPDIENDYELTIFSEMYKIIEEYSEKFNKNVENVNIYHWGSIENTIIRNFYKKYENDETVTNWKNLCLVDFNKIFQEEGILIKGVYGFGLKEIGKSLIKHGLVQFNEWDTDVSNGLDAMISAYNYYKSKEDNEHIIKDIIKYNEFDVRFVQKIVSYLRKNHTL